LSFRFFVIPEGNLLWPLHLLLPDAGFSPSHPPVGRAIFLQIFPQIRLSSPYDGEKSDKSRSINHLPPKNTWHSSYAPTRIMEVVEKIFSQVQTRPVNDPIVSLLFRRLWA
jgi:hypothetical protein